MPPAWLVPVLVFAFSGCSSQAPPSAAVRPAPVAAASQEPIKGMLARWNWYRESVGLPRIAADPQLSEAAARHSKYVIQNHLDGADAFIANGEMRDVQFYPAVHTEARESPWYSLASERAANSGYIVRSNSIPADGAAMVDAMMPLGFNALALLNPQLTAIGYGSYCENRDCVMTVSFEKGLDYWQRLAAYDSPFFFVPPSSGRGRLTHPVFFPPTGGTLVFASFNGNAQPNPQTSCGYTGASGPPIALQIGAPDIGIEVKLSSYSLTSDGMEVESCAFDAETYKNPDGGLQAAGRRNLHSFGAVMLIPRKPLEPGHTYTVSMTADNEPYTWSFTVAPDAM